MHRSYINKNYLSGDGGKKQILIKIKFEDSGICISVKAKRVEIFGDILIKY
jgi:hypothetical protein